MLSDKNSLKLAKKILFLFCLIFTFQTIFPNYAIAAEINFNYGPVELAFVNHPDNPQIAGDDMEAQPKITSQLPQNQDLPYYTMYTMATAYTSRIEECDADPFTASRGDHVYWGMIASNYFPYGTKLQIPEYFGDKIFVVKDAMNERYNNKNRIDIWMDDLGEAKAWGARYIEIRVLK